MRIISFNINGIRAAAGRGLVNYLKSEPADVICLQEIRAGLEAAEELLADISVKGYKLQAAEQTDFLTGTCNNKYYVYINPAEKKGYSGTAVLSKIKPLSIKYNLEGLGLWNEGRIIVLEFETAFIVNCYIPHGGTRLEVKLDFLEQLLNALINLKKSGKTVILASDMNIAHSENDLSHPDAGSKMTGFLNIERELLTKFIAAGFIDSYREFHDGKAYTWSSYRSKFGRVTGYESWTYRFDYILVNSDDRNAIISADILYDEFYSDHYPVIAEVKI